MKLNCKITYRKHKNTRKTQNNQNNQFKQKRYGIK